MRIVRLMVGVALIYCAAVTMPSDARAASSETRLSKGQTLYVPVYSNVFSGPKQRPFGLATTLSVRNTDLSASLTVTTIDYYDTSGKLVRHYLEKPVSLGPLASTYVHIPESDFSGGFGASFIVKWGAARQINSPIVECVMVGATSGQGISFVSSAQEIRD